MQGSSRRSTRRWLVVGFLLSLAVAVLWAVAQSPQLVRAADSATAVSDAVDPQELAGELLLIATSEVAALGPLRAPARELIDLLARHRQASRTVRLTGERIEWLGDDGGVVAADSLDSSLGMLLERLRDAETRRRRGQAAAVSTALLVEAFAAPTGIAAVHQLYAATMAEEPLGEARRGGQTWFERGGLILVDDQTTPPRLHLVELEDDVHRLIRAVRAAGTDRLALAELRRASPLGFLAIDPDGLLQSLLERTRDRPADDPRFVRGLEIVLDALEPNAASSYMYDQRALLTRLVAGPLPSGRWVGAFHTHPGRPGGDPPSPDDIAVAQGRGRFVTIVLKDVGFDLYDLRADRRYVGAPTVDLQARPTRWSTTGRREESPAEP